MKKIISFVILLIGFSVSSLAQSKLVVGTVTDEAGEPIIGATVMIKGTAKGTVTDLDGYYEIVCESKDKLVYSALSYITKEEKVMYRTVIDVTLKDDKDWPIFTGKSILLSQYLPSSLKQNAMKPKDFFEVA